MRRGRNFLYITAADFIVRSAYQMGKTPLLPIFAATLGASGALLGLIVSVSTITGMLLKPLFGVLSDRRGRRVWLIIGTLLFTLVPFAYGLIRTPEHLVIMRLIHGLSTAIYGPVTLAYVAEISRSRNRVAEDLGWFEMAREGGYIVGPMVAAWLLLVTDAVTVFTIIGLVSSLAFIFVLRLDEPTTRIIPARLPLRVQLAGALKTGGRTPAIWLSGSLQATAFIALYALKAFLPIYALSIGINVIVVGTFFSLQEAVHILLKPAGGRFGDRLGHLPAIALGMGLLSAGLSLLTNVGSGPDLLLVAAVMGAAQALIFPSATALVSRQVDPENLGAGMGFVGTMKNAGKVLGPIISGALIGWLDYGSTFHLLALALVLGSVVVLTYHTGAVMRQRVNA